MSAESSNSPAALAAALKLPLPPARLAALEQVASRYPVKVTPYYLSLAETGCLDDPVLRQFFPDPAELEEFPGAAPDALGENADSPVPGLVRRYADRALLILTGRCAVHCRHCLRKRLWETPGGTAEMAPENFHAALDYLAAQPEIREIIVSGGDPLTLPDSRLFAALEQLRALPQRPLLRLASRLPAVLPERLSPEFCAGLRRFRPLWFVTHFNHPRELTPAATAACANLLDAGIPVLNQTVLLRGINDSAETLAALFTGLLASGVKPYYLFHGDPISGTCHFRTGLARGLEIMRQLRASCSGLAVPSFALDLPAGNGKIVLEPDRRLPAAAAGEAFFAGRHGNYCAYPDA